MQSWTWLLPYPKDPLPSPRPLNLGTALTTKELFTLHLFPNSLLVVALSVCLLPHLAPSPASFLSINTGRTWVAEDTNMEVATKSMCSYTSLASSSKGGLSFCSLKSNSSLLCGGGRCWDLWASTRHCMPVLRCQDLGNTALPWNADVSGHTFLPLSRFSLCWGFNTILRNLLIKEIQGFRKTSFQAIDFPLCLHSGLPFLPPYCAVFCVWDPFRVW
jgi:hypothetical protein